MVAQFLQKHEIFTKAWDQDMHGEQQCPSQCVSQLLPSKHFWKAPLKSMDMQTIPKEGREDMQASCSTNFAHSGNKHTGHYFFVYVPSKHLSTKNSKRFRCSSGNKLVCKLMFSVITLKTNQNKLKQYKQNKPNQTLKNALWKLSLKNSK